MIGIGLSVALVAYAAFLWVAHNRFVRTRQHLRESWSAIDVELRRRYDLVPQLVGVVQGHAAHEQRLLQSVVAARAKAAANDGDHAGQIRDEEQLAIALGDLFAVAERYPSLTADESFRDLADRLAATEDRIAAARRFHNANVREWRILGEAMPWKVARPLARWSPEPYFSVPPAVRNLAPPAIDG